MSNFIYLGKVEKTYVDILKMVYEDTWDWISYFVYECNLGDTPKEVINSKGEKRKIKNVNDLWWLLKDDS